MMCAAEKSNAWASANPDKVKAMTAAYYAANPERQRARARAYYDANTEKVSAKKAAFRAANLEKCRARDNARKAANPEAVKACSKKYYDANAEKIKAIHKERYDVEYSRRRHAENPDHRRAYTASYYEANKEKVAARRNAWRKAQPDKTNSHTRNRRALKLAIGGTHTDADIQRIFEGQQGQCNACSAELAITGREVDHIVPILSGGGNDPSNLQILCPSCNSSKNAKNYQVWLDQNKAKLDKKRAYWAEWRSMQSAADAAF